MAQWRIWIDTGGTFTDCLALSPEGRRVQVKVLSSSALRATAAEIEVEPAAAGGQPVRDAFVLRYEDSWGLPVGFANDADLHWLGRGEGEGGRVVASKPGELTVRGSAPTASRGRAFEMRFDEESPVLAARLATGAASVSELPPLELRLATTKGTNALLERNGAENALLVTRGFADLLWIGDQRRPDIFARHIERPEPLASHVVEIDARLDARGEVIEELDLEALGPTLVEVASTYQSVGIAFLHSHRHGGHEEAVAARLRELGVPFLSIGASLSPTEGYLARMRTAAVDAYLQPVIRRYLDRIGNAVGGRRLRVMTSAGGLVSAERYRAKDSLLSGPAGGVVGAATAARRLGFERIVAFDMGGTSTDVSRFDGDYEYRFEHRVGDAEVAAPSLAIETVAAGGGSICRIEGQQLKVGPQSAGAHPGPACYGAGGPLTLTDVNLLLGRL
ncbi:MAG: hydantoinase/oxoprolinase family protein, partial [Acidobacteriota bacterium]